MPGFLRNHGIIRFSSSLTLLFLLVLSTLLNACAHKINIQQGNVLTQESMAKIAIGMHQDKVVRLVGNPLLVSPFHPNRWDYVYSFYEGNSGDKQFSYVSLLFDNENLIKIDVRKDPLKESDINTLHEKSREQD